MRAIRTIAALLLLLTPLAGQRTDTRFSLLGSDISTVPTTLTLDASDMIGQTQHTFTVTLTDAPSQTCAGGFVSMAIQGSYDNSTWTTIGEPLSNIQVDQYGAYTGVARADAAYPRIRFRITAFDAVNCRAAVAYSGTLSPTSQPSPTLLYPIYEIADGSDADVVSMPVAARGFSAHTGYVAWDGCSSGSVNFKLQGAYESSGPWEDISDDVSLSYDNTDLAGRVARGWGEYPLVRAYIHLYANVSCTGGATVYYWGSNAPPDPARRWGLGSRQSLVYVNAARSTAGTTVIKAAETDRYYEILFLSLVAPCSGVAVSVTAPDNMINAQDGPFSLVWPLTGQHYYSSAKNTAIEFTTTGTGCVANLSMQYRIVDEP